MTDTRDMTLAGQSFVVPPLPLGVNRVVYPLCRQLSLKGALVDRVAAKGLLEGLTDEDLGVLADVAFACAQLSEPTLDRATFDAMAITPPELFDAFMYVVRFQTGMWIPTDPSLTPPAGDASGEAAGEAGPQSSTSTESSPA